MSVTCKLPPSGRDFEVHRAVVVGGKSTREAAEQFRLSQTRVCQIVERMRAWQAEVLPAEAPLTEDDGLRLAKNVAGARLDFLYCEVMDSWRQSHGQVTQTRSPRFGDEVTTTKTSHGDPKYLLAAMRLSKAAAELGAVGGLAVPEEDVGWAVPTTVEEIGRPEARPTEAHPVEDCSRNGHSVSWATPAAPAPPAATAGGDDTSVERDPPHELARRQFFAPVQHDQALALASPGGGQIEVSPERPGLSVQPRLSRQQRRKLARAARAG